MPVLDALLQVASGLNLTNTTETTLTYSIDQQTVKRHMENGEEVGFGVFVTALTKSGTETYNFKVLNDAIAALTSGTVQTIAQTGAMVNTDARIDATQPNFQNGFFLTIPPNALTQEFVGMSMLGTAGNGATNITVTVYLMNESEWSQYQAQPANYTP